LDGDASRTKRIRFISTRVEKYSTRSRYRQRGRFISTRVENMSQNSCLPILRSVHLHARGENV
jgi:hypothetical protein